MSIRALLAIVVKVSSTKPTTTHTAADSRPVKINQRQTQDGSHRVNNVHRAVRAFLRWTWMSLVMHATTLTPENGKRLRISTHVEDCFAQPRRYCNVTVDTRRFRDSALGHQLREVLSTSARHGSSRPPRMLAGTHGKHSVDGHRRADPRTCVTSALQALHQRDATFSDPGTPSVDTSSLQRCLPASGMR